jgi:hypothetical protein
MPIVEADLWKHPGIPGMIVVTSSATIEEDGRLYMQYGECQEAIRRIPGIDVQCGQKIQKVAPDGLYGFLPVRPSRPKDGIVGFGLFQTRRFWNEPDDLELIQRSMQNLRYYLEKHPKLHVRMNYPGIESGMDVENISRLLQPVPSSVTLCHHGEVPPQIPYGLTGTKELFLTIERWIQEGRFQFAVEYLMDNGFEPEDARNQVMAVQRMLRERAERYALKNHTDWEQRVLW